MSDQHINRKALIFMIGGFPPPVHGMSTVNQFVRDELLKRGAAIKVFNVAPGGLGAGIKVRLRRLFRVIGMLAGFAGDAIRHHGTVYIGVSGGYGQIYDCLFVLVARMFGRGVVLHHHSFAYLRRVGPVSRLLFVLAGRRAWNIVLCDVMAELLCAAYPQAGGIKVLSNAFAVGRHESDRHPRVLRTVGFLGNIAYDKGILDFLEVAKQLEKTGTRFVIAGPFQDNEIARDITARLAVHPTVRYLGPVYAAAKEAFYDSIDVLLFPTRYRNEAEPLTVLESMSRGIPAIARGLGCIPSMLASCSDCVADEDEDFNAHAGQRLRGWLENPQQYQRSVEQAREQFQHLHAGSVRAYGAFLDELATGRLAACSVD